MQIEIVAIGTEVVTGTTVNSNAAFISHKLLEAGYRVSRHSVLHDDPTTLKEDLTTILNRSDLVITTGGLGPTHDDITREVLADLFNSEFSFDETVASDLSKRYTNLTSLNDQATVPSKAKVLINPLGTAPGFIFEQDHKSLICLPGVPAEMKAMFEKYVLAYLKERFNAQINTYRTEFNLLETSESEVDPFLRESKKQNPEVEFGIYPRYGTVSVHLWIQSNDKNEALRKLNAASEVIKSNFGARFFESASGSIEEAIHLLFNEKNWKLSVAESCTGGTIAARLTRLPGASNYFQGSVVAYSNSWKENFLNVPTKLLTQHGAVSEEVVKAMAKGLLEKSESDFVVAISGVAGPTGGTLEKPVGTIWIAVGEKSGEIHAWKLHRRGNRDIIIESAATISLGKLYLVAKGRE